MAALPFSAIFSRGLSSFAHSLMDFFLLMMGRFGAVKIVLFGLPQAKKPLPQSRRGTNMYE
jgi:hypothetical protein